MMESVDRQLDGRWQYAAYFAISLVALIFILVLLPSSGKYFRRFFGETNAILVIVVASAVGTASLWALRSSYEFVILKGGSTFRGVALSLALATVLAVAIVIADFIIRYPQDMNVPVPQSLLFYPAIGFVAEIVFHVLPVNFRPKMYHLFSAKMYHSFSAGMYHPMSSDETPLMA